MTEGGYAATFLREADKDRYFATLLLKPGATRGRTGALRLFRRRRVDP